MTNSVVIEREMPHPPAKVWRALTQGALLEEWLMPNDFQPVLGHKFTFRTTPMPQWNGIVECEVLAIEPSRLLSYSWNTSDDTAPGLRTVVTWTLSATQGGTLLRIEQTGFGPGQEFNYKGAQYGWQRNLGTLERVIAALD